MVGSRINSNPFNQPGSCSMHNTLRRPLSSAGGLNTTLEDDVFFDDHLEAPNSAKPLLSESRQFYLQNFPHLPMSEFQSKFYWVNNLTKPKIQMGHSVVWKHTSKDHCLLSFIGHFDCNYPRLERASSWSNRRMSRNCQIWIVTRDTRQYLVDSYFWTCRNAKMSRRLRLLIVMYSTKYFGNTWLNTSTKHT